MDLCIRSHWRRLRPEEGRAELCGGQEMTGRGRDWRLEGHGDERGG